LKRLLTGAAFLLVLWGCGQESTQETTATAEAAPELSSGIAFEYMDESIRPGDDFFSYVNGDPG
jgi:putative endopeptidase